MTIPIATMFPVGTFSDRSQAIVTRKLKQANKQKNTAQTVAAAGTARRQALA